VADVGESGGFEIRRLRSEDLDAVVAIEADAFTSPWDRETFAGLLERDSVELLVMDAAEEGIVGYAVLWCILDQGELANIALLPTWRGRGLGSHMLRHVMSVASERGVEKLFLEVRMSNHAALELYRSFGFSEVGVRRGYYQDPKEDASVMVATLDRTSEG